MIYLCYPKCSTCQKAQKWLDANGIQCEIRHIMDDRPTAAELRKWHKISGLPLKKFFNTSDHDGGRNVCPAGNEWNAGQAAHVHRRRFCAGGLQRDRMGKGAEMTAEKSKFHCR